MEPYLHSVTSLYELEEIYIPSTKHYGGRTERFNTTLTIVSKTKC